MNPWALAALTWLAFLVAIAALGAAREKLLRPRVGEPAAHVAGTLAACLAVILIGSWSTSRMQPTAGEAALIGAFWLVLGLVFEFGVFGLIVKKPWSELLADYRIDKGRLLPLLWLTTFLTPIVAQRLLVD